MVLSERVQNLIDECIDYACTDMFFTYLFRRVIFAEMGNQPAIDESLMSHFASRFRMLSTLVLNDAASYRTNQFEELTGEQVEELRHKHVDVLAYAREYIRVSSLFVQQNARAQSILQLDLRDQSPLFPIFFQECMLRSCLLGLNRNNSYLNQKEEIIIEAPNKDSGRMLKIYLSPFGALRQVELVGRHMRKELRPYLDELLMQNGLAIVEDKFVRDKLDTSFVYKSGDLHYFFQKRPMNDYYIPHGEQDRGNPMKALLTQGQINFKAVKLDPEWQSSN